MAVGGAVKALKKGRLDAFRNELTPEARLTLGAAEKAEPIRQKLAGYTHVSAGPALLVSAAQGNQGFGHFGDVKRTYEATIAGSPRPGSPPEAIYTFTLDCSLAYEQYHHDETPETCNTTIDDNGVPWTSCSGGSAAYDSIDLTESCAVADVAEAR